MQGKNENFSIQSSSTNVEFWVLTLMEIIKTVHTEKSELEFSNFEVCFFFLTPGKLGDQEKFY